ncbi:zinc finger MYND domain-containing protein 10-like [Acipenser oxyrinchus oxyrinchus]|uniref:Zinc finger MYND domain-containing protein 10 n=1 Tax=Acipenser oxyrinchus oxyrinchus TaxID=40147 RepID=A0AAD8D2F1_ACIOX|nr:zinc finger MYND domain-containing protein 10-like [Acipenser oxyrinchus oxyrinchus]
MESATAVLFPGESEGYVQSLETYPLKEIGSARWFRQHEYIEKLNMQAILNATAASQDEFVKEHLISYSKIPTLIYEMISVEIWKHKVFPILCQLQDFNPKSTFPIYMVIHHEATIINLLETVLFHKESCEAAEEAVLDLLDYCLRKVTCLAAQTVTGEMPTQDKLTQSDHSDTATLQDLQEQNTALEFDISLKALSILRYITDHIDSLTLSTLTRMLNTHNLPCVLVQLVEHCPWSRRTKGQLEKYMDGKWYQVPKMDHLKMTKLDGQVWICLLNLLLRPECQQKYDFNDFNKGQLLKLRGFLTEVLIDQLPNLGELQRFLSHLSVTDPAPSKRDLILEQIPEIMDNILKENSGKWKAIAKYQVKQAFNPCDEDLQQHARRLAQTYNLDVMESLIPEKPKCGFCGSEASKRCSRCQGEWYCRRECQVKHWQKHKKACELMAETVSKLQGDLKIEA